MKYPICILLLTGYISVLSQNNPRGYDAQVNLNNLGKSGYSGHVHTFNSRYEGIKGTPYLNKDWKPGAIILNDGSVINNIHILFDIYQNELYFKRTGENNSYKSNLDIVSQFYYNQDTTRKFIKKIIVNEKGKPSDEHFLKTLYSGRIKLYLLHGKEFIKADYEGAYSAGRTYDEFIDKETLYLKKTDGIYYTFKPSKRCVKKLFYDKIKAVNQYMKNNKIDLHNKHHLADLVRYYDSL